MIDLYYWTTPNGHKITISWKKPVHDHSREHQPRRSVQTGFSCHLTQQSHSGRNRSRSQRTAASRLRYSNRERSCSILRRRPESSCLPALAVGSRSPVAFLANGRT